MFKNQRINIIITTIIVTVVLFLGYDLYKKSNPTEEEVFKEMALKLAIDTSNNDESKSDFPQIANLYDEYRSNRVAFDKKHDDKPIEFEGTVSEITNNYGCAGLKFKINDENNQYIAYAECSNCPANKDKWSDEIAQLQIGQTVRIRGYYSTSSSSSDNINFYKCHILK